VIGLALISEEASKQCAEQGGLRPEIANNHVVEAAGSVDRLRHLGNDIPPLTRAISMFGALL
jgi:hypothetical protein